MFAILGRGIVSRYFCKFFLQNQLLNTESEVPMWHLVKLRDNAAIMITWSDHSREILGRPFRVLSNIWEIQ